MRNIFISLVLTMFASSAVALPIKNVIYPESAPGYIKVYVQPSIAAETDILFVVDNSGSMQPHQAKMAQNIPMLAQIIADRGVTTHAAVLSTDMDGTYSAGPDQGQFRQILRSSEADFKYKLADAVMLGTFGSPNEKHFEAVKTALTSPLLEGQNAGFIRPNAHLTIIVLTDAEDQSAITGPELKLFLNDFKGAGRVSIFAFMSPSFDTNCDKDDRNPIKLEAFVTDMGGEVFNICQSDWRAPMISIGEKMVKEILRTIQLPTEPVMSTIEVRYGSKTLTGGDLRRGWVYDQSNQSIIIGDLFDFSGQDSATELEIKFVPKYWQ